MQDEIIFDDIAARIAATEKFYKVQWGRIDTPFPATGATVQILRVGFKTNLLQAGSMGESERLVTYHLILDYYNVNPDARRRKILRYEAILINLLNGKQLGGLTQPDRTLFEVGADDNTAKVATGQSRVVYTGTFTYLTSPTDGFDTGDI
jgi:hypothetical protein